MLPGLLQDGLRPLLLELLQLAQHGLIGLDAKAAAEVGDHRHLELPQVGDIKDFQRRAGALGHPRGVIVADKRVGRTVGADEDLVHGCVPLSLEIRTGDGNAFLTAVMLTRPPARVKSSCRQG